MLSCEAERGRNREAYSWKVSRNSFSDVEARHEVMIGLLSFYDSRSPSLGLSEGVAEDSEGRVPAAADEQGRHRRPCRR